ncbi:hypothetical protein BD311DRAFT_752911 [Dichomitus squalens]|uniref:Uncharacterized protein n=1 Tax=Dichomitus squalens TaxID=114155 RepID=A0A4Q9MVG0_9APHY|nr:hypothetical protein BD311DRAFT_752911 [Dichomitus squalens]
MVGKKLILLYNAQGVCVCGLMKYVSYARLRRRAVYRRSSLFLHVSCCITIFFQAKCSFCVGRGVSECRCGGRGNHVSRY